MNIALGRLAEAVTSLVSRQQKQLALGAESVRMAGTLCELGTVKWKLGQLDTALAMLMEARLICGKSIAENEELMGDITNRIGTVLETQGKYDDAMQSYVGTVRGFIGGAFFPESSGSARPAGVRPATRSMRRAVVVGLRCSRQGARRQEMRTD